MKPRVVALATWVIGGMWLATSQAAGPGPEKKLESMIAPDTIIKVVKKDTLAVPVVTQPCQPGKCPFAGQKVTIIANKGTTIMGPFIEAKTEFEAATGAKLEVIGVTLNEHFANFMSDVTNGIGKIDASIAAAWWVGELVAGDFILPVDKYYKDSRFPKWDIDDVLPAPRSLLTYGKHKYMVAYDHDGQVFYYRRDLFNDAAHQTAFKQKYGYPLAIPQTWDQVRDIAEYFHGKDLNADGKPDAGLTMHLKAGAQGMFHYMSFSAPYVIGPGNPHLYWFDPQTMKPLIESPGHVKALQALINLTKFGPREILTWDLGESWDYFLAGRAAMTFTWGDLGALAQNQGSYVKGKTGAAPIPGSMGYYNVAGKKWVATTKPNIVGNTTGGSWAGVISRYSKAPEATYFLLAMMANKEKVRVFAAQGFDGVDPGRTSQLLPPDGVAKIDDYLKAGWAEADIRAYSKAYAENYANPLQMPYLRIPGAYAYWLALDIHLFEAVSGQLTAEQALRATAVDFEEITTRMGRDKQRKVYRASLGL
ncbi:extracellular solute-binding protein [Chitinivorax sp. B]|uniref:ABC transporter substrate-binding protein n=1 Tax=Chitinivorax sp. B TaxID=2502235 RepID=UPI0020181813|nr:extracellular solute-binding protein [Chitinivorax sp. B]